ncbi:hypothetical protein BJV82DRAFT_575675 [Fennellomyces sp. T-0311]|nr:hypothetical protein BJV82DRAFT_575675 [Fennellomyces sp. T-0311]
MDALTIGRWHRIESISDIFASGYFAEIFSTCLELEQFHYIGGRGASRVSPADNYIITHPFRLTSLHLDFAFDLEIIFIAQILQHCPKLVDLEMLSDTDHDDRQLLEIIHTHCPKLTNFKYLRRRGVFRQGKQNQMQFFGKNVNFHVRSRIYMTEEDLFLTPWIHKFHMSIENLNTSICLLKPHKDSFQQLSSVQYPQLRILDLHCICDNHNRQYSSTQLSAFLEACPALEELCLLGLDSINDTVLKSIGKLPQLYLLALELGDGSMVTPQGIRWLFATTTSLKILNLGGSNPYFTNQHLYAVAQYKRLTEFSVSTFSSQLTTFGVHKFVNLIRDTDIEYLLLGRLHDLDKQTILAFAQLQKLKNLEIGVFTRSTQSRIVYDLFEARTSDHTLTVNYLNGPTPEFMTSAVDYY